MTVKSVIGEAAIDKNLKQFLLVLSVSLSVATLPGRLNQELSPLLPQVMDQTTEEH